MRRLSQVRLETTWPVLLLTAALAQVGCRPSLRLPPAQRDATAAERQARAFVEALKPRRPGRPLIAVAALNEGTEITDFLLTHATLRRADVADVQAVAPRAGRVQLYPALQIDGAQDLASFDRAHPAGADYVIVPAMREERDPALTAWLKQQSERGARIIGICVGALVVANAGLLDGRRFVTHWYSRQALLAQHPSAVYVPHQRYVVDRDVATTTGITASVPTMLALIEAIAGRDKAQALASELGARAWTPEHDSGQFGLNVSRGASFVLDKAKFWRNDRWHVAVQDDSDDIALAFAVDAWSRTGHISVDAAASGTTRLRSGLTLLPDVTTTDTPRLPLTPSLRPLQQLDHTLCEIAARFGPARSEWVMMELEYPPAAHSCGPN